MSGEKKFQRQFTLVNCSSFNDRLQFVVMTVARKPTEAEVNFPGEGDTSETHLTLPPQLQNNSTGI
jgi:hypothetical protein